MEIKTKNPFKNIKSKLGVFVLIFAYDAGRNYSWIFQHTSKVDAQKKSTKNAQKDKEDTKLGGLHVSEEILISEDDQTSKDVELAEEEDAKEEY